MLLGQKNVLGDFCLGQSGPRDAAFMTAGVGCGAVLWNAWPWSQLVTGETRSGRARAKTDPGATKCVNWVRTSRGWMTVAR